MSSLSFEQLYGAMIAGSVPAHTGDVEQSAAYVATDALDTSAVHYHFFHAKGDPRAYYFAVPSKALSSFPNARTPLTAAIPGAPGHLGEGAYVVSADGLSAAALLQNGELRLLVNSQDVIQRHLAELGVPVHEVESLEGGQLTSSRSRGRGAAERLSSVVSKLSIFALGVAVFGWFGLTMANGYVQGKVEDSYRARSQALATVAQQMNFSSPLSQQVSKLHSLGSLALRSGGYIEKFEYRAGATSYELAVPKAAEEAARKNLGGRHESSERDGMVILAFNDGMPAAAAAPATGSDPAAVPSSLAAAKGTAGASAPQTTAQKVAKAS